MIAWLVAKTGLSAIAVKLILGAAAVTVIFVLLQQWGAKQWAKGEQQGRNAATADMQAAKEKEWAVKDNQLKDKEKQLSDKADSLAEREKTIAASSVNLERLFQASRSTLLKISTEVQTRQEMNDAAINNIPDAQLLDSLRIKSNELAKSQPNPQ